MNSFILNNTNSIDDAGILKFIEKINNKESITFTTSGTTGEPKEIIHSYDILVKNIKIKDDLKNTVWGLTYDWTKIAGSQVILQSYLNGGKIVNLFKKSYSEIINLITEYGITHISATPTFYRLLGNVVFENVNQVTLGGEVVDANLITHIEKIFPNAKITNIYALTEFGTLFTSSKDYFEFSEKISIFVKIENNNIFIKQNNEWIDTGDVIEWLGETKFKIIGRETNMINVGGVKVNPIKVEEIINELDYVSNSIVYGKENSVMGMIVAADVVLTNNITVKQIKNDLIEKLNQYEIPLKINIVDTIKINSNGKLIRK
jgi:acyl-CoA synthetase (AMP-forming)/AMP-acid ligase II